MYAHKLCYSFFFWVRPVLFVPSDSDLNDINAIFDRGILFKKTTALGTFPCREDFTRWKIWTQYCVIHMYQFFFIISLYFFSFK